MQPRHVGSLYRRSGAETEDSHGRAVKAWALVASTIPVDVQGSGGRTIPGPKGQDVRVHARAFVQPSALPAGVSIQPGDGLVITSGRSPRPRYIVHTPLPQGAVSGRWADELLLEATDEAIP